MRYAAAASLPIWPGLDMSQKVREMKKSARGTEKMATTRAARGLLDPSRDRQGKRR